MRPDDDAKEKTEALRSSHGPEGVNVVDAQPKGERRYGGVSVARWMCDVVYAAAQDHDGARAHDRAVVEAAERVRIEAREIARVRRNAQERRRRAHAGGVRPDEVRPLAMIDERVCGREFVGLDADIDLCGEPIGHATGHHTIESKTPPLLRRGMRAGLG